MRILLYYYLFLYLLFAYTYCYPRLLPTCSHYLMRTLTTHSYKLATSTCKYNILVYMYVFIYIHVCKYYSSNVITYAAE